MALRGRVEDGARETIRDAIFAAEVEHLGRSGANELTVFVEPVTHSVSGFYNIRMTRFFDNEFAVACRRDIGRTFAITHISWMRDKEAIESAIHYSAFIAVLLNLHLVNYLLTNRPAWVFGNRKTT